MKENSVALKYILHIENKNISIVVYCAWAVKSSILDIIVIQSLVTLVLVLFFKMLLN